MYIYTRPHNTYIDRSMGLSMDLFIDLFFHLFSPFRTTEWINVISKFQTVLAQTLHAKTPLTPLPAMSAVQLPHQHLSRLRWCCK